MIAAHTSAITFWAVACTSPFGASLSNPVMAVKFAVQFTTVPVPSATKVNSASTVLPLPTPFDSSRYFTCSPAVRSVTVAVVSSSPARNASFGRTFHSALFGSAWVTVASGR